MHVQISYVVDLDDIPKQILKLLRDIESSVTKITDQYQEIVTNLESSPEELGNVLKQIKACRDSIVEVDIRLLDCQSIAEGYQIALVEGESAFSQPNTQAEDPEGLEEVTKVEKEMEEMTEQTKKRMGEIKESFSKFSAAFDSPKAQSGAPSFGQGPSPQVQTDMMKNVINAMASVDKGD